MSFKEYYWGNDNDDPEKIDQTEPLQLVSRKDSVHGMFSGLAFKYEEETGEQKVTVSLDSEDFENSSDAVRNHLALNGVFKGIKKVETTVKKEVGQMSVDVRRGSNRVSFAFDMVSQECSGSSQKLVRKRGKDRRWEPCETVEDSLEDLYFVMLAVEKHELNRRGGTL